MKAAVVGAGIMGASAALALAERGHEVTLYEQFSLEHSRGSSHGRSRIIRKAYPDPFYTSIMAEAYGLWHALEARSGVRMVYEPGLLYFGKFESESLRGVLKGLEDLGIDHEVLDPEQAKRVSPRLLLNPGEIGIFTPEAGWVRADLAVRASIDRVVELGGRVLSGTKPDIDRLALEFDRYLLCPGAWITLFVPVPVRVTLQTFAYVAGQDHRAVDGPVWIHDAETLFYGFPSEPGAHSYKIGLHSQGLHVDPDDPDRTPPLSHMRALITEAEARFGAGAEYEFTGCLYTSTADEDFLLGRHGDTGFFASACSGHGFKFGPWIGKTLADFVEERDAPENHSRLCWPKPLLEA